MVTQRVAAPDSSNSRFASATDTMTARVDALVMGVNESLRALRDHGGAAMDKPEDIERISRILQGLDALDEMMVGLRENIADLLAIEDAISHAPASGGSGSRRGDDSGEG